MRKILTKDLWEDLFPIRNNYYTLEHFFEAAMHFPYFCKPLHVGNTLQRLSEIDICKRELAAFLAHVTVETNKESDTLLDDDGQIYSYLK